MRAALGGHQRMNFVDDDGLHRAQGLGRLRGQNQIEGFGRGNQNVGGMARKAGALALRRVAGANADLRLVERNTHAARHVGHAGQRRAQIPLHVHGQRLQRRHVNNAATAPTHRRDAAFSCAFLVAPGLWSLSSSISRSRHHKNAASVLPVPVGARISAFSPRAITGQPMRCGAVGASKTALNHAVVTG